MDDDTLDALLSVFKPIIDAAHIALYHYDEDGDRVEVWRDLNGLEVYADGLFHRLYLPESDEEIKGWVCDMLGLPYEECDLQDLATGEVLC